jgi:predicted enzyme related to lactoylglutathione lyase
MGISDPGSFCWFELGTSDQPAAVQFYRSLFHWDVNESPMGPGEVYPMFTFRGLDAAAAYTLRPSQRDQGVPPHWMIYVAVTDTDATSARAAELGGVVVVPPFDVFDFGRMAVIQDPTGAMFSIWQGRQHKGAGIWGVPGAASWGDLSTPDQARAGEFYSLLFGWRMVSGKDLHEAEPGEYFHILNGNDMIGGITPPEQRDPNAPPSWMTYFEAESCSAATSRAKELGGTAYLENMAISEEGHVSVVADPQGAVFGIHAKKP